MGTKWWYGVAAVVLGSGSLVAPSGAVQAAAAPATTTPAITTPGGARSAWERALDRSVPAPQSSSGAVTAAAAAMLTVTPSTGLVHHQTVRVTGTGFAPGELAIAECTADPTGPESCDLRTLSFLSPDPSGAVGYDFTVARTVLAGGLVTQCDRAPGACTVMVTNIASSGIDAFAPLTFAAGPPGSDPTISVTPNSTLLSGQAVTVTGSAFPPNEHVILQQCPVGVFVCNSADIFVAADATGAFSAMFPVSLRTRDQNGIATTCLAIECVIVAIGQSDIGSVASAGITFDPSQPLPEDPTITVTPAVGLLHRQAVTVAGAGFDPGALIGVSQCAPGEAEFCDNGFSFLEGGADGTFTTTVVVTRLVAEVDFGTEPFARTIVDCVVGGCAIQADQLVGGTFGLSARAPIEFDASVPTPPIPTVTATPTENLPYRAAVTVSGAGFAPGEFVFGSMCVSSLDEGFCNGGFGGTGIADASGSVTLIVPVRRITKTFGGQLDCLDPNVECSLSIGGELPYEQYNIPLTFDPDAPIPPPPAISVVPNTNLDYRQSVEVQGTGFAPGSDVVIEQCATRVGDDFPSCAGFAAASTDLAGSFTTTFSATRVVFAYFLESAIDCTSVGVTCLITATEFDSFGFDPLGDASAPISFNPDSVPPPPPRVTVTPATGLRDGQVVEVAGSGFSPHASIGLAECRPGPLSYADCDLTNSASFPGNPDGTVSTSFTVRARIETANGPVDCLSAPGVCVLAVANLDDPVVENTFTPLTFEVGDLPSIDLESVSVREGTGGVTPAPVEVELSDRAAGPVTVHWRAIAGTASPADYTAAGGTVVIPAGADEGIIPAEVVADALDESTERFTVVVDSVSGATISDGDATVKIKDDDPEPVAGIADATVSEGAGFVDVPVIIAAKSGRTVTIEYRTHHDSARSGRDFERSKGVVTFAPGEQLAFIRIPILDDRDREKTESFTIELDDAEDARIVRDTGRITITDDD